MKVMKRLYAFRNEPISSYKGCRATLEEVFFLLTFIRYTLFIGCRRTLKMIFKCHAGREGDVLLVPFVPREVSTVGL